jgi:membrane-associated phospholipid phosphatase
VLALAAAHLLDGYAFRSLVQPRIYESDFGRLLRIIGYFPTWLVVSAGLLLGEPAWHSPGVRQRSWKFLLPAASAAGGGIATELLKLVFRRERPLAHDGEYFFRAFSENTWSTSGLALPSSHTGVAFGGAAMMARLFPRGTALWYTLASGCALSRVVAQAHFLSDVVLAAIVAWLVAWSIARATSLSSPALFR